PSVCSRSRNNVLPANPDPHGKSKDPFRDAVCDTEATRNPPESFSRRGGMQRYIVEDGRNPVLLEAGDQRIARGPAVDENVIRMRVLAATLRDDRPAQPPEALHRLQQNMVVAPDREPTVGQRFRFLQLCPEKRGGQLARQIGRSEMLPGVL